MDFSTSLPLNALGSLSKSAPRWCSMSGNSKQLISCFSCTWHWNYQNSFSVCNQSNLILQLRVSFESPFSFYWHNPICKPSWSSHCKFALPSPMFPFSQSPPLPFPPNSQTTPRCFNYILGKEVSPFPKAF
jgi:hypothetical protein